jgi:tRNA A37 threonylcarbamoyladenosine dehydratase
MFLKYGIEINLINCVDIYIKSQNRCIEVKSTWTNQEKNNVLEKQLSAINLGNKLQVL